MLVCEVHNEFSFGLDGFFPIHYYTVKNNDGVIFQSDVFVGHTNWTKAVRFMETQFPSKDLLRSWQVVLCRLD